jgi:hypothetical protein
VLLGGGCGYGFATENHGAGGTVAAARRSAINDNLMHSTDWIAVASCVNPPPLAPFEFPAFSEFQAGTPNSRVVVQ